MTFSSFIKAFCWILVCGFVFLALQKAEASYLPTVGSNIGIGTSTPVGALTVMSGNVGVGTWSPTSRLQVVGTVTATTFVGDGAGLTNLPTSGGWTDGGTNVYTSTTTDTVGIGTTTASSTVEIVKQGTSVPLMVSSTATGDGNYLIVDSVGNVGINTVAPVGFLHVRSSTYNGIAMLERSGQTVDDLWNAARILSTKTSAMNDGFGTGLAFELRDNDGTFNEVGNLGYIRDGADNSGALIILNNNGGLMAETLRIKSNGNVGIGTTTPVGALTVMNGNVGIGTWSPTSALQIVSGDIDLKNSGIVSSSLNGMNTFALNNGVDAYIKIATNGAFRILDGGTNSRIVLGSDGTVIADGNVGIGTSTLTSALSVMNGNVGIGTWLPSTRLQVIGTVTATSFVGDGSGLTGISANSGWTDGGTNVYTSTTTDTVGIGTTTAPSRLTIAGNIGVGTTLPYRTIAAPRNGMALEGNLGIGTWTATDKLVVMGGNVGIGGAPSLGGALEIYGDNDSGLTGSIVIYNGSTATNAHSVLNLYNNNTRVGGVRASSTGATSPDTTYANKLTVMAESLSSGLILASTSASGPMQFLTGGALNSNERMRLDASGNLGIGTLTPVGGMAIMNGNVGIGTWSPTSRLQVVGTVNATAFVGDGSGLTGISANSGWTDGGTNVYASTTTDNVGIGTTTPSSTFEIVKTSNQSPLMLSATPTGDGDMLIVMSSGNVGIGTRNPDDELEIKYVDAGNDADIRLDGGPSNGRSYKLRSNDDGFFQITDFTAGGGSAGLARLTIDFNGNVGIGSTINSANLPRGLLHLESALPRIILFDTDTAISSSNPAWSVRSEDDGFFRIQTTTDYSAYTDRMTIDTSGRIGIGTFTPADSLSVIGNIGLGTTLPYRRIAGPSNGMAIEGNVGIGTWAASGGKLLVVGGNVGVGTVTPVGALTIMNGNVGIGTWSPTSRLQVVGTVNATAFVGDGSGLTGIASGGWSDGGTNVYTSTTTDNVGIGTTTPAASLTVENVGSGDSLRINDVLADTSPFVIDSTGNVGIGTAFPVGGLTVMNGNVGIGTWSPAAKLEIFGDVSSNGNIAAAYFDVNAGQGLRFGNTGSTRVIGSGANLSGDYLQFQTGFTAKAHLDFNGNLGIGTTAPLGALTVMNGNVGIGTWSPTSRLQVIGTVNATSFVGDGSGLTGISSNSGWTDGGTNVYTSTTTDNVGIGTTTPSSTLEVVKISVGPVLNISSGTSGNGDFLRINSDGNVGLGTTSPRGGFVVMNGNVGLGTTDPANKLNVVSSSEQLRLSYDPGNYSSLTTSSDGILSVSTKGITNFKIGNDPIPGYSNFWPGGIATPDSTNYGWQVKNDGSEVWFNAASGGYLAFTINNASTLPIMVKGTNVGVGYDYTASLTSLFNVNGSATISGNVGLGTTNPVGALTVMNGNVGIGTWSPTQRLQVVGTVSATAFVGDGSGLSGISANSGWTDGGTNVYTSTTTDNVGVGTTTPTAALMVQNAGTQASFRVNDAVTDGSPFIIDSAGNVGVGTTAPTSQLHVDGGNPAFRLQNDIFSDLVVTLGSGGVDFISNGGSGFNFLMNGSPGPYVGGNLAMAIDSSGNVGIGTNTPVGGLTVMSGNVGVGTWSPRGALEVKGTGSAQITINGVSGGCLMFRDTDNAGWTECNALNGVLTCSVDADGICDGS